MWVVAPETNQSGASHSLTLHEPLRLRQLDERAFAVRGTPTDSVIMGVRHILKDKAPDLVLSGINSGANMAEDVTYSGTIAGAFEGTILGIRSIALSQAYGEAGRKAIKWHTAMAHGPGLIRKLLALEWAPFSVMNINFPDREPDDVVGHRRHHPGQARSGPAADRRAARHLGQSLLLAGLRAAPLLHAGGHRSVGGLFRPHLRDAAVPRPDASGDAREAGRGAGNRQRGSRQIRQDRQTQSAADCPLPTAWCQTREGPTPIHAVVPPRSAPRSSHNPRLNRQHGDDAGAASTPCLLGPDADTGPHGH